MTGAAHGGRIASVLLDRNARAETPDHVEAERRQAIDDLLTCNAFAPLGAPPGPYRLRMGIEEGRLVLRMQTENGNDELPSLVLSLKPYRRIITDYFLIVESYEKARAEGASPRKIEAIDMGRRGLHNEGAALLKERLESRIEMDLDTARRLFTLICVLHIGQARTPW